MASVRGRDEEHEFGSPPGGVQRARVEATHADSAPALPMAVREQVSGKIKGMMQSNVSSNVFHLKTDHGAQICLYSVSFTPHIPEEHRKTRAAVFQQAMAQFFERTPRSEPRSSERGGSSVYDDINSLCMTSRPLVSKVASDGIHVYIVEKRVKRDFHINFRFRKQVNIADPADALLCEQLINNLMRRALDRRKDFSAVGNTFMLTKEPSIPSRIGGGCKIYTAFSLNVRKFIDGLFFVVDITRKPLFDNSISRQMKEISRMYSSDPDRSLKECDKRFKKMTVFAPHNRATYKVIG
jgi:hypothetical protein